MLTVGNLPDMALTSRSLFWRRTDTIGTDHALVDEHRALRARGTALAVAPIPHTLQYAIVTANGPTELRLDVTVEGAGWRRTLRLERTDGRWRAITGEDGDLDRALTEAGQPTVGLPGIDDPDRLHDAVDVDLSGAPLFNILPIRRLGLPSARPGTQHRITVALVLLPGLLVVPAEQVYTALDPTHVRFASGSFTADLELDPAGYVTRYPGLAELVAGSA